MDGSTPETTSVVLVFGVVDAVITTALEIRFTQMSREGHLQSTQQHFACFGQYGSRGQTCQLSGCPLLPVRPFCRLFISETNVSLIVEIRRKSFAF